MGLAGGGATQHQRHQGAGKGKTHCRQTADDRCRPAINKGLDIAFDAAGQQYNHTRLGGGDLAGNNHADLRRSHLNMVGGNQAGAAVLQVDLVGLDAAGAALVHFDVLGLDVLCSALLDGNRFARNLALPGRMAIAAGRDVSAEL